MSTFYEITQVIKNKLQEDLFVNTVTTGDIFKKIMEGQKEFFNNGQQNSTIEPGSTDSQG